MKKTTVFLVLSAIAAFASTAYADAASSIDKLDVEEKKLKTVMSELKSCYAKNPTMQQTLKKMESSWLTYRKSMIEAAFPMTEGESIYTTYGSQGAQELADFNVAMTQQHIKFLNSFSEHETPMNTCKKIANESNI